MENNLTIRKAERKDVGLLLEFIRGIAKYENIVGEAMARHFCCIWQQSHEKGNAEGWSGVA